jgi:hypothetical protein
VFFVATNSEKDVLQIGLRPGGARLLEKVMEKLRDDVGLKHESEIEEQDIFRLGVAVGIRICQNAGSLDACPPDEISGTREKNWNANLLDRKDDGILSVLISARYGSKAPYKAMEKLAYIGLKQIDEVGFDNQMKELHSK